MKPTLKILLLAISFLMATTSFSQSNANGGKTDIKNIKISTREPKKDISHRPKAPSLQQIDCIYADENLYISFAIPEGNCNMTVTDLATGLSLQYVFDTEESAEIHVGTLSSAYLELETENGHSYEGWIE